MVLTGGYENSTSKLATEYSGINNQQVPVDQTCPKFSAQISVRYSLSEGMLKVSVRELAHLIHSRHAHACGTYHLGDIQVHESW